MASSPLRNAALLAHPWRPAELSQFSESELREAGATLLRQKVSLQSFRDVYGEAVLDTPLAECIERDAAKYHRERDEFETIRRRLAESHIETMLFKSAGLRPSFHYLSSNLDVIVRDGNAEASRRHLTDLGYVELLNAEEPKKFLFRRFPGDDTTFAFHLHEQVGWGVPFLDSDALWEQSRPAIDDHDIRIPAPGHALLITVAHWFYEDKSLSLGNLLLTAQALHDLETPLEELAVAARAYGWEEGFWGALRVFDTMWRRLYNERGLNAERAEAVANALSRHSFVRDTLLPAVRYDDDGPATVPFMLNKIIYYQKILRDTTRSAWRKASDVTATLLWAVRWKLHIRSQRPVLVSISGADGSGKSHQAGHLSYVFDTCDLRHKVMWSRGASSSLAGLAIRVGKVLMGQRSTGDGGSDAAGEAARFEARRASVAGRPFAKRAFATLLAVDLFWSLVVRTRLSMLAGNLVICDRYVYDALVDYALYTGDDAWNPPPALRRLVRMAPVPHVRVLLDVEPETALRRKPEEGGTEHLEDARSAFLALAEAHGVTVTEPGESAEEIARRLARLALGHFYEDYGTVLNRLLYSNPDQLNP